MIRDHIVVGIADTGLAKIIVKLKLTALVELDKAETKTHA